MNGRTLHSLSPIAKWITKMARAEPVILYRCKSARQLLPLQLFHGCSVKIKYPGTNEYLLGSLWIGLTIGVRSFFSVATYLGVSVSGQASALRYFHSPFHSREQNRLATYFSLFFLRAVSRLLVAMQQPGPIRRGNWVDIGNESEEQITAGFERATWRELEVQRGSNGLCATAGSSALGWGSEEHDFIALAMDTRAIHPFFVPPPWIEEHPRSAWFRPSLMWSFHFSSALVCCRSERDPRVESVKRYWLDFERVNELEQGARSYIARSARSIRFRDYEKREWLLRLLTLSVGLRWFRQSLSIELFQYFISKLI